MAKAKKECKVKGVEIEAGSEVKIMLSRICVRTEWRKEGKSKGKKNQK